MKATEIRALSAQDLNKKLADLKTAVAWIDYCTRETVSGSRRIYY